MVRVPILYSELIEFLKNDGTHKLQHSDLVEMDKEFRCLEFGVTFKERANSKGIKCAIVFIHMIDKLWNIPTGTHVMNAVETIDKGIIYIEPQEAMTLINDIKVGDNLQILFYEAAERNDPSYNRNDHSGDDISFVNGHIIYSCVLMW
jgi:hypothetical protein